MLSRTEPGFSVELFLDALRTEQFGRAVRVVAETASTIALAREWLWEGEPEGAVVIAGAQTDGRGRHGRQWASPRGGLWMSVIARPDLDAAHAGRLGIGLGLAAAEAVSAEAGCEVGLKWPNDLVIGDRKAGGVLVGAETEGGKLGGAVLSLGLNVNLSLQDLPEEVRGTATTLREETGREHRVEGLAARVLAELEAMWPSILGDGAELVERWMPRDVLMGREVSVEIGGTMVRGRAGGIDADGALIVAADGGEQRVRAGEVAAVRIAAR
jgi:BirA family biotin operon repressor/biotin-[acetyl-CoA-carboxylase] ligase